jgi:hypothetical protein
MFEKQPDDEVCYRGKLVTFRNNVVTIYLENAGKKTYAIEKIISKQWEGCEINDAAFKVILIWERNRDNDPWKCQLKNEADYSIIATLLTAGPYSPPDLADRAE